MIINFFGIQLQVIDNGDGTFSVRPIDSEVDRTQVRAEIQRLRAEKDISNAAIASYNTERDYHTERRTHFVDLRTAEIAVRDSLNVRIDELKVFLESAGETDV